jgi:large subunit ribosomal protein L17
MGKTGMGRKLNRRTGFRMQLLRGLTTELIRHEQIQTTLAKAKECARFTDRLVHVAKKGDLNAHKAVAKHIKDRAVTKKLFEVLAQRYSSRVGGVTRIFKLQARQGDNASMALIKLIA